MDYDFDFRPLLVALASFGAVAGIVLTLTVTSCSGRARSVSAQEAYWRGYHCGVVDATRGAATVERIENDRGELVWGEVVKVEPKEGNP